MIVLLEYFPTSISVCIWNKFYASLYLKDVMNMSLFKILTMCGGGIVGSLSLFLVIRIMFVLNSKFCRELRVVLHKPSVVEEGVK
jgi:hypothetical protein